MEKMFNNESGLKGICGANDMREIIQRAGNGDESAQFAIDIYCYRIRKYIGAYCAVLGKVDALVFTGGIGENAALIRQLCCENLDCLGMTIDKEKNKTSSPEVFEIQEEKSPVKILVIPTNEELEIAHQTYELIKRNE
jgi:acetate kinase